MKRSRCSRAIACRLLSLASILALVVSFLPAHTSQAVALVHYVVPGGTGAKTCASWANACDLQAALGSVTGGQIWVKNGTYKPTSGTDRTATFTLVENVTLYGGFAGTETKLSQRNANPLTNATVLSGEIGDTSITTDNSYHVVTAAGLWDATLDGFTITAGYADGSDANHNGGGLLADGTAPNLNNIRFYANYASYTGGGLFTQLNDHIILDHVTFDANSASYGGGLYDASGTANITDATFKNNQAGNGGGIYNGNYGTLAMTNVTMDGNSATNNGGAIDDEASNGVTSTINYVTITRNSAGNSGGGIYNTGSTVVYNSIIWLNSAVTQGAQVYLPYATQISIYFSDIQDGCMNRAQCYDLITGDPHISDLGLHGGDMETVITYYGSPARDAANSDNYGCPSYDQRGVVRPQGSGCDMGSTEYDGTVPFVQSITRVDANPNFSASVAFQVEFTENVQGVDASDFALVTSGTLTGVSITGVEENTGSTYTVTISTGTGSGTLRLDLIDDQTIFDIAGNALGGDGGNNGSYTIGEVYDIRSFKAYLPTIIR